MTGTGVGLVGVGAIGRVHAAVLADPRQQDFVLRAAADPRPVDLPGDVELVPDHRHLLSRDDVAVVAVATPPDSHYAIAAAALRAGKHVLLEKPPTLTVADAAALLRLARRSGLCVTTAWHARFGPATQRLLGDLAHEDVVRVEVDYREDVAAYHPDGSWVLDPVRSGGGVVMDSGINALSILTAGVRSGGFVVQGAVLDRPGGEAAETRAEVALSFGDVGEARLRLDWRDRGEEVRLLRFRTRSGAEFRLDLVRQSLERDGQVVVRGHPARAQVDQHEEYLGVYRAAAAALRSRTSDVGSAELGLVAAIYARAAQS